MYRMSGDSRETDKDNVKLYKLFRHRKALEILRSHIDLNDNFIRGLRSNDLLTCDEIDLIKVI